jgi:hypothetical protein
MPMKAMKFQLELTPGRKLELDPPPDAGAGPVEVIVLYEQQAVARRQDGDSLSAFLDDLMQRPGGLSKEELDRRINEERNGWD